jgi:hypothetical protein
MSIVNTLPSDLVLLKGVHNSADDGMCLLEAVAYVAGEPHSDHPKCVCPVLGAFGRRWNDGLPDDETRTRLLAPFIPRLIGTRSTPDVQDARAFLAADWAVRIFTPAWLRLAGLDEDAAHLEQLDALESVELCHEAMPVISAARKKANAAAGGAAGGAAGAAAWDAAWDAAGAAAGDAAWDAAGGAAGAAAWDAAWDAAGGAAGAAAWDAAWDAAGAAAGVAAWAAAGAALRSTVVELQASAVDLFDRMIEIEVAS